MGVPVSPAERMQLDEKILLLWPEAVDGRVLLLSKYPQTSHSASLRPPVVQVDAGRTQKPEAKMKKLELGENCIDVTERELGTPVTIVGARAIYLEEIPETHASRKPRSPGRHVIVGARKP